MGMTPLLLKMTGLGFIKKPYHNHVTSDDLGLDPQMSSGPREPSNCDGFVKSLKSQDHPQLLSHLFIALEKS